MLTLSSFLFLPGSVSAQEPGSPNGDECELSIAELPTCGKDEDIDDCQKRIKILGEAKFKTWLGEEERTLKVLPIPRTNLFTTGVVFYTDEYFPQKNCWDSMQLSLIISRKSGEIANSLDGLRCHPGDFIEWLRPSQCQIEQAWKLAVSWLRAHPALENRNFGGRPWTEDDGKYNVTVRESGPRVDLPIKSSGQCSNKKPLKKVTKE
jgi:hypothetical protein